MLVAVETVDGDRDVPATLRILLGIGVQYPLVARCCDGHRSGLAQEVHVERGECRGVLGIGRRHHAYGQALKVEAFAGAYLHGQCRFNAWHNRYGDTSGSQRLSVDAYLSTQRIQLVGRKYLQHGQTVGSLRLLALVAQEYHELGSIVHRYAAHALLVEANLRVHNLQRTSIEYGTWVVDLGNALILPWVLGRTATGTEDESARTKNVGTLD